MSIKISELEEHVLELTEQLTGRDKEVQGLVEALEGEKMRYLEEQKELRE